MSELKEESSFYKSGSSERGLRFTCTRCSACCRFDSGFVWVSDADLSGMATGLDLSRAAVLSRYCRVVNIAGFRQISLAEQANMDCVFWIDGACSVYEHRPLQCRSFPFWAPYLGSREDWDGLALRCPGVNVGELHSAETIDEWLASRHREAPLDADSIDEVSQDEG